MSSIVDFSTVCTFTNGVAVLNATPHPLTFQDGECVIAVDPSGARLDARAVEHEAGHFGVARLVVTVFEPSSQGESELSEIERTLPNVLVVGSLISAQAYPGRVVAMTPAAGFERRPAQEKRMCTDKFTVFPKAEGQPLPVSGEQASRPAVVRISPALEEIQT